MTQAVAGTRQALTAHVPGAPYDMSTAGAVSVQLIWSADHAEAPTEPSSTNASPAASPPIVSPGQPSRTHACSQKAHSYRTDVRNASLARVNSRSPAALAAVCNSSSSTLMYVRKSGAA
eukprot:CAMPEP_0181168902 /NCGR_PEP_ID=MMETSP1096-20121128/526_1 /TAXON_ID=156174 ORGANISM="Chrysochromulina ericina, Strain CCMP281" /NCGR_SAMPLE_ID=MMETSP1096 /ASSEMBLY_ACC=CAM_ASM_000453 /LENGTH=118 /DNA_ID=CAMNT_0023256319 /DNA_START=353 /DNA_END=710 /DNA_ORIENTATION=+